MRYSTKNYALNIARKSGSVPRSLIILAFATAYTLVVLPFTVNFFRAIASVPASDAMLFTFIPLDKAHLFMLPLFLAALEFASIQLAVRFWTLEEWAERSLVCGLFLMCQSFTVTSVYYDIRHGNLAEERNEAAGIHKERFDGKHTELKGIQTQLTAKRSASFGDKESQIERITRRIGNISAELASRRRERVEQDRGIANLVAADSLGRLAGEVSERRTIRRKRETEQDSLINERTRLERDLARIEQSFRDDALRRNSDVQRMEAEETRLIGEIAGLSNQDSSSPSSTVEYIVANLFTARSSFATLIALLFPVTIMGIGFVINPAKASSDRPQSLNLEAELVATSSYSPEGQQTVARHLVAIIATYVTGLRASKELARAVIRFHQEDEMRRAILDELLAVKETILKSRLSEKAILYLSGEIDQLINQQLNEKGATPA